MNLNSVGFLYHMVRLYLPQKLRAMWWVWADSKVPYKQRVNRIEISLAHILKLRLT